MSTPSNPSLAEFIARAMGVSSCSVEKLEQSGNIKLCIHVEIDNKPNCKNVLSCGREVKFHAGNLSVETDDSNDNSADNSRHLEKSVSQKHPGGRPPKYDQFRFGVILTRLADEHKQFASRQKLADAALAKCEEYALRSANDRRGKFEVPSLEWIRPLVSDFAKMVDYEFKNDSA